MIIIANPKPAIASPQYFIPVLQVNKRSLLVLVVNAGSIVEKAR